MKMIKKDFTHQITNAIPLNAKGQCLWKKKQKSYWSYEYEYLTGEEILPSNQQQIIDQVKFTYSPLGKAFQKQAKEHIKAIKYLNISDKASELKQIEAIFPQNVLNDLISNKLKTNH